MDKLAARVGVMTDRTSMPIEIDVSMYVAE